MCSGLIEILDLDDPVSDQKNPQDPYFVEVKHTDKHGRTTVKKERRPIPEILSSHDKAILKTVRKRAYRLDRAVNLGCIKFGWSSIIGLIPG